MAEIELRPDAQWFAEQMELKLRENDHKGGWEGVTPLWLMARLREELDELEGLRLYRPDFDRQRTIREAADIANFAMMIAANARFEVRSAG